MIQTKKDVIQFEAELKGIRKDLKFLQKIVSMKR